MKKITLLTLSLFSLNCVAQLINEFQPNPTGTDPSIVSFEIKGIPGSSFSGFILGVESDPESNGNGATGLVDRINEVSGIFDSNGLLVVEIADFENPSFTIILTDSFTGDSTTDIDLDNDGTIDQGLTSIGTVYDAIGIADSSGDLDLLYADDFGGVNLPATFDPVVLFRDDQTNEIYYSNSTASIIYNQAGEVVDAMSFDSDPFMTSFGENNPVFSDPTLSNPQLQILKTSTKLFPNPVLNGEVALVTDSAETVTITLYNTTGVLVKSEVLNASNNFSVEDLSKGIYFTRITTKNGELTKKLIVQ